MALYSLLGALAGALTGWALGLALVGARPWRLAVFTSAGGLLGVFAVPLAKWLLQDAPSEELLVWAAAMLAGVVGSIVLLNALAGLLETDTMAG
ncbi:MAG: hypothetical protein JWQ03_19 [Variovorax sp.]|nr:hypothetical protein [Variovorax sp.]